MKFATVEKDYVKKDEVEFVSMLRVVIMDELRVIEESQCGKCVARTGKTESLSWNGTMQSS